MVFTKKIKAMLFKRPTIIEVKRVRIRFKTKGQNYEKQNFEKIKLNEFDELSFMSCKSSSKS